MSDTQKSSMPFGALPSDVDLKALKEDTQAAVRTAQWTLFDAATKHGRESIGMTGQDQALRDKVRQLETDLKGIYAAAGLGDFASTDAVELFTRGLEKGRTASVGVSRRGA